VTGRGEGDKQTHRYTTSRLKRIRAIGPETEITTNWLELSTSPHTRTRKARKHKQTYSFPRTTGEPKRSPKVNARCKQAFQIIDGKIRGISAHIFNFKQQPHGNTTSEVHPMVYASIWSVNSSQSRVEVWGKNDWRYEQQTLLLNQVQPTRNTPNNLWRLFSNEEQHNLSPNSTHHSLTWVTLLQTLHGQTMLKWESGIHRPLSVNSC
jgi:hypothetical protein